MKKGLLVWLLPILLSTTRVDSTQIEFVLSHKDYYQFHVKKTDSHFSQVPSNPNLYHKIDTFFDRDLTQKKGEILPDKTFTIVSSDVNKNHQVVFELEDSSYILADPSVIYDDVILQKEDVDVQVWFKKNFTVYSSPISNQQESLSTSFLPYQSVKISEIVRTPVAEFAKISEKEWVLVEDLSMEDNRMEGVQELINQKYFSEKYGIYVKQLSTEKEAGIHQDTKMYSASISKLPLLYYAQEQLDAGRFSLTEGLQYIDKVQEFQGSYSPEGSGSLNKTPDNKHYSIEDLINRIAKQSDNAASNLLAYYLADGFDKTYYKVVTDVTGQRWDMSSRQASPKMAAQIMEAIYQQNGYVLASLQSTNFDQERIARDIPDPVAHKIGDAYDFRHDVAIVYTKSPFILAVFTDQSDYDTISQIANDIYGILK